MNVDQMRVPVINIAMIGINTPPGMRYTGL